MGNQKQKWKPEEEEALKAGVAKYGTGRWKNILMDPEFASSLSHRSNIDLKDKWRNMGCSNGVQFTVPRVKAITAGPLSGAQNSASAVPLYADDVIGDTAKSPVNGKAAPRYNAMIFEALSTIKDSNGSDLATIVSFIEQRHEVPQNFRRSLSSKFRRLVLQGKLEKIKNCYKITDTGLGTKTPSPKQKDVRPRPSQHSSIIIPSQTIEDVALSAAYMIADAESKSFLAAEAVKEAERVSKMTEDAEAVLHLIKEIYEHCSN
ncbi:hypothetical protein LguiB_023306 [Lonicera macranthoides]